MPAADAPRNWTTTIPVERTLGELQRLLARAGARSVRIDYDAGVPTRLDFVADTPSGPVAYRLPMRADGVLRRLQQASQRTTASGRRLVPGTWVTREQAVRVGWRQVRDWVAAQLALIDTGAATLDEVMLPYEVVEAGRTLYDAWSAHKALPRAGSGPS
jgi:hypothetical protein